MKVRLNETEVFIAAQLGMIRQMKNIKDGRRDAYGAESMDGWGIHVEGTSGEMALAKATRSYYNGNMGDLKAGDVNMPGVRVECRTTSHPMGRLILHEKDHDDAYFFLIVGSTPDFEIKGWIKGIDGKKQEYWCDPTGKGRHAYFVPTKALLPVHASGLITV